MREAFVRVLKRFSVEESIPRLVWVAPNACDITQPVMSIAERRDCTMHLLCREARWRRTLCAINHLDSDKGRLRWCRGHRRLERLRWDEVLQFQTEASSSADV